MSEKLYPVNTRSLVFRGYIYLTGWKTDFTENHFHKLFGTQNISEINGSI